MSVPLLVALYALCCLASAFFSSSETALTSLTDAAVFRLKEEGHPAAPRLERLRANLARTIGTMLVGNTMANAAAGSIGAALAISIAGEKWGVLAATATTTVLLLVFAEVTPKTYAARNAERLAVAFLPPTEIFVRILAPLTSLLATIADLLLLPLGGARGTSADVTEADVKSLINLSHEQGGLQREEKDILHAVLDFGTMPVRDAMIPRPRIVALPVHATFEQVTAVCREHRYSRYPVWRNGPDDIIGILHAKDLYDVSDAEEQAFDLARYLRPAIFVPELKKAGDLFREMRRRFHIAVVVDELGVISGLVTLEDLIERIVGDISDEHDEPARRPVADGASLLVEGTYALASLERDLGVSFDAPDAQTVAGLLLRRFGRIPKPGFRTREGELEFLVDRASPRAIERVRITRRPRPAGASA